MTNLFDAIKKGPVMTMTLDCETEFPKALKNLMLSLGFGGAAIYKGFPFMEDGQEYWWVQLHLYRSKKYDHKNEGNCIFTNPQQYTTFFDSARSAAWEAIKELGERLTWKLHHTQKDLEKAEEEIDTLEKEIKMYKNMETIVKT